MSHSPLMTPSSHPARQFGAFLKDRRISQSLTMGKLASKIDIGCVDLCEIEHGIRLSLNLDEVVLNRLIETLDMSDDQAAVLFDMIWELSDRDDLDWKDIMTVEETIPVFKKVDLTAWEESVKRIFRL